MALSQRSRAVLTLFSAPDCVHCHRVRLVLAAIVITILVTIIAAQAMWRLVFPARVEPVPEVKPYQGPVSLPQPGPPAAAATPQAAPEPKTAPPAQA